MLGLIVLVSVLGAYFAGSVSVVASLRVSEMTQGAVNAQRCIKLTYLLTSSCSVRALDDTRRPITQRRCDHVITDTRHHRTGLGRN